MTRDPRKVSETAIHKAVAQALGYSAAPGVVFWHTPNGELRDKRVAAKLRSMGVRAGVPDFTLIMPRPYGLYGPLVGFIELKSEKGRLSLEQRAFKACVHGLGCLYAMPRSIDEALDTLSRWGAIKLHHRAVPPLQDWGRGVLG